MEVDFKEIHRAGRNAKFANNAVFGFEIKFPGLAVHRQCSCKANSDAIAAVDAFLGIEFDFFT